MGIRLRPHLCTCHTCSAVLSEYGSVLDLKQMAFDFPLTDLMMCQLENGAHLLHASIIIVEQTGSSQ